MQKKQIILIYFLIIVIVIAVMWFFSVSGNNDKSSIVIPQDAIVYTDTEATIMLKDERLYSMTDLIRQEVYLIDQELNADFWFDEKVNQHQINNARGFVITRFVLRSGQGAFLGTGPYVTFIMNKDIEWNTVSCKIYAGNKLVSHENYDEKGQLINP